MSVALIFNQTSLGILSSSSRSAPMKRAEKRWMNPALAETFPLHTLFRRCSMLGPFHRRQELLS